METATTNPLKAYAEFLDHEKHRKSNTIRCYITDLQLFCSFNQGKSLLEATTEDLVAFFSHYETLQCNRTLNRKLQALASFFRWASKTGLMAVSPTSPDFFSQMRQKYPIVARGKVREVTFEDGQKLLAAVHHASPLLEMRDKILFWIMLQHGVRATEALKLNIDDVRLDTDTKTIVIPSIVRLHREAGDRVIDVSAIAELLGPYVKQIAAVSANGWLFPNKSGTCMSIRSVRRFFTRAARKAGLPTNMHLCVQNYIIQSLRRGVEMRDLQRELGLLQITAIRQYAGCAQAPSALQGATAG